MDYKHAESETVCCFGLLIGHILSGLATKGLIEFSYYFGQFHTNSRRYNYKRSEAGGVFTTAALGIELFGWANAKPSVDCFTFFDKHNIRI